MKKPKTFYKLLARQNKETSSRIPRTEETPPKPRRPKP